MNIIKFKPIYVERVWGGTSLKTHFYRDIPNDKAIGESWDISDRQEANSIITAGKFVAMTLRQAIRENSEYIMGKHWDKDKPFPILIKWLDCSAKLSIQVHPNKKIAEKLKAESKTEAWYIHKSSKNSELIAGFKRTVSKEEFIQATENGSLKDLVYSFSINDGDSLFVPSGRIHCIDAGNLILEIQENSDTTYRVYDWDRSDQNGKKRELHLKEALECIDFDDVAPTKISTKAGNVQIADCPEFSLRTIKLKARETLSFKAKEQVRIISVAEGSLESLCTASLEASESAILPYAQAQSFVAKKDSIILITENFA